MNPKKNIPHPEEERGRANSLLLFILAFIAASFTLLAGTSNTGQKKYSIKTDPQCTYGKVEYSTDKEGKVNGCSRPALSMRICKPCTSTDNPAMCDCDQTCVPNGSVETGIYMTPTVTITNTTTINAGGKLQAAYEKLISATINKDGSTTHVYTITGKGDPQCYFMTK